MSHVLISLASNHEQQKHHSEARQALAEVLSAPLYTAEIWTEPEGTKAQGPQYLNQLVSAETLLNADELNLFLKQTELKLGRTDDMRRQGLVPIDLDLLQFDEQRYHLRDWQRSYVKRLLELL